MLLRLQVNAHQLRQCFGIEFFHHLRAVYLDRALADAEVEGDGLVGRARENPLEHLKLPWREFRETRAQLFQFFKIIQRAAELGDTSAQHLIDNDFDLDSVTPDADEWKYEKRLF